MRCCGRGCGVSVLLPVRCRGSVVSGPSLSVGGGCRWLGRCRAGAAWAASQQTCPTPACRQHYSCCWYCSASASESPREVRLPGGGGRGDHVRQKVRHLSGSCPEELEVERGPPSRRSHLL